MLQPNKPTTLKLKKKTINILKQRVTRQGFVGETEGITADILKSIVEVCTSLGK